MTYVWVEHSFKLLAFKDFNYKIAKPLILISFSFWGLKFLELFQFNGILHKNFSTIYQKYNSNTSHIKLYEKVLLEEFQIFMFKTMP